MEEKIIKIKKINDNAKIPTYATEYAAGCDLYALLDTTETFMPGETKLIKTGISMEIPVGYAGLIYARSGLASKKGLAPANKVGVIDSDYRGEIIVPLHNDTDEFMTVFPQDRIAQLVIMPYLEVDFTEVQDLDSTERGSGGFGSTGTN